MNILVAEDSVAYALLYQQIFESRGHSVKLTLDGEECLSAYVGEAAKKQNQQPYDVVVLDHSMPKKTGFDVAKEILKVKPGQKILFITAFGDELESKIEELGNDKDISILEKPFNSSSLIEKIELVLKEETTNKILLS
jgi:two-component system cell cycle response regulator CpdR